MKLQNQIAFRKFNDLYRHLLKLELNLKWTRRKTADFIAFINITFSFLKRNICNRKMFVLISKQIKIIPSYKFVCFNVKKEYITRRIIIYFNLFILFIFTIIII